jgi:DNA-binding transcriptional LysR family regulator
MSVQANWLQRFHGCDCATILEDYEADPLPIHVLYREGRRAPARVRSFVDFVVARLRADKAFAFD